MLEIATLSARGEVRLLVFISLVRFGTRQATAPTIPPDWALDAIHLSGAELIGPRIHFPRKDHFEPCVMLLAADRRTFAQNHSPDYRRIIATERRSLASGLRLLEMRRCVRRNKRSAGKAGWVDQGPHSDYVSYHFSITSH